MFCVATALPVVQVGRGWGEAVPNLLLVQAWWRDPYVVYGMNAVSWSLSCEVFFYACFPVTVIVLRRMSNRVRWAIAALGVVVALVLHLVIPG